MMWAAGLGQKPPHPRTKSLLTKKNPIMNSTRYLYIGIFAHILELKGLRDKTGNYVIYP
jgi:hypothetical protein